MLRQTRGLGDGAEGEGLLRRKGIEGALKAACNSGKNDTSLARETLGASVDNRNDSSRIRIPIVVYVYKSTNSGVEPAPRLYIVQSRDNALK